MQNSAVCEEAEQLWASCIRAAFDYHDEGKRYLLALIHRDYRFAELDANIEVAEQWFCSARFKLKSHLKEHGCESTSGTPTSGA